MRIWLAIALVVASAARDAQEFDPHPEPSASMRACRRDADCTIVGRMCCGNCSAGGADDVWAIRRSSVAAYMHPCEMLECPACLTRRDPAVRAVCSSRNLCTVVAPPRSSAPGG